MTQEVQEKCYEHIPWALKPEEEVYCPVQHRRCYNTSVQDKKQCNLHGCPYDVTGEDGYF